VIGDPWILPAGERRDLKSVRTDFRPSVRGFDVNLDLFESEPR